METKLLILIVTVLCGTFPIPGMGQTPDLGSTSNFAVFTKGGALTNTGTATHITGDIGSFSATSTGFTSGIVTGTIYNLGDAPLATASTDVSIAYNQLSATTNTFGLATPLEHQTLAPGVYCTVGAASLNGDLTLNGAGNADAIFIIKVNGAFSVSGNSHIVLTNSALSQNIYWQIGGQFDVGAGSAFKGTVLINRAVNLLEGATLEGRILTIAGAVSILNNAISIPSKIITDNKVVSGTQDRKLVVANSLNSSINILLNNSEKGANYSFSIYTVSGKELEYRIITAQSTTISTRDFPAGIYLYRLTNDKKLIESGKFATL